MKEKRLTVQEVRDIVNKNIRGVWSPHHNEFGHFYKHINGNKICPSVTSFDIVKSDELLIWAVKCGFEWLEINDRFSKLTRTNRDEYLKGAQFAHKVSMEISGTIGTTVHNAAQEYLESWEETGHLPGSILDFIESKVILDRMTKREIDLIDISVKSSALAVEKYLKSRKNIVPILIELPLGSAELGVAGTADLFVAVLDEDGLVKDIEYIDWKTSNGIRDFYAMQSSVYSKFFEDMTGLKVTRQWIVKLSKNNGGFSEYKVLSPETAYDYFLKFVDIKKNWINSGTDKLVKNYNLVTL